MIRWRGDMRAWALLALLGLAAVLAWQILAFHAVRHDDPFITYRYGQNLARGAGLTFNPGQRFLGATSPGHMLIAAATYALVGLDATPSWMSALGCVGWTLQAVAAYFLVVPTLGARGAGVVAAAIALGAASSYAWVPFETNLVAAFGLGALALARHGHWRAVALLTGGAVLMRPDALILATLLGGACALQAPRRALTHVLVLGSVVLPWVVFAFLYYGSPIPHSAVEKFQRTEASVYLPHELALFARTALPYWPAERSWLWAAPVWLAMVVGALWLARRERFVVVVLAFACLHWAAYLVLRPFVGHEWHLYPANLIGTILVLTVLAQLARVAERRALRWLAVLSLAGLALAGVARSWEASRAYDDGYWTGGRDRAYRRVAAFLASHAAAGDEFASVEVGTLAYYADLPAYDLGGLVTDLRRTNMVDRPVRWLVLDRQYMRSRPKWEPVFSTSSRGFEAFVFFIPAPR
jgi:hypothetical protein